MENSKKTLKDFLLENQLSKTDCNNLRGGDHTGGNGPNVILPPQASIRATLAIEEALLESGGHKQQDGGIIK